MAKVENCEGLRKVSRLPLGTYATRLLAQALSDVLSKVGHDYRVYDVGRPRGDVWALDHFYEAVWTGRQALAFYPSYPPAVSRICYLLCGAGRPTHALEVAVKALSVDSEWAEAWFGKGLALSELDRHMEALESLNKAIELQLDYGDAWFRKGTTLLAMSGRAGGLYKQEESFARQELDPDANGVVRQALEALNTALTLGSDNAETRSNRAVALSLLNEHSEAVEAVDGALELEPENRRIRYVREYILQRAHHQTG
jgi:tetratricopeptide (TPR) repeat protein